MTRTRARLAAMLLLSGMCAALAGHGHATVHTFTFEMRAPAPTASQGTATVVATFDDVTSTLDYVGFYQFLEQPAFNVVTFLAGPCEPSGPFVSGSPTSGGTTGVFSRQGVLLSTSQAQALLDGRVFMTLDSGASGIVGEIAGRMTNGRDFCNGCDGALASCPCDDPGDLASGCGAAGGVRMLCSAWTSDGAGGGTATFTGKGFAHPTAVVLIRARARAIPPAAFGDGLLCLGQQGLRRLAAAQGQSTSVHDITHAAGPGAFAYQLWFRDATSSCTPQAGFNLSNAVELVWQ